MAEFSIDASQLLQSVFGAYGNFSSVVPKKNKYGVPIITQLSIPKFGYKIRKGDVIEQLFFEGYAFTPALLLSIRQEKNIVKTAVQGRNGTVKELISDGDYSVSIRGIILPNEDEDNDYPLEAVARIRELCSIPAAIPIESELLNMLGIYALVIELVEFIDTEATPNIQAFTMACVSDNADIDARINQGL